MMEDKRIYTYLSYLRVIACVAIVWLHTFTMEAMFYKDKISMSQSIASNTMSYIMMWAVPCFVMVTGALLLNPQKEISIKSIYCRYIFRIFLVLVIFVSIFTISDVIANKEKLSFTALIKRIGYKLYTGTSWSHLWYLYLLIGLYILLPVFRALVKALDDKELKYIVLIYFIFNSVIPIINQISETQTGFYITTSSVFPLYLILGYLIHSDRIRLGMKTSILMLLIGELFIVGLSVYGIKNQNTTIISMVGNYSFVPVVIASVGMFGLFKNIKSARNNRILLFTDKLSFGIYLIHLAFLRYGIRFGDFNPFTHGGIAMIILIAAAVFAASFFLTAILKMIPGIKKIL